MSDIEYAPPELAEALFDLLCSAKDKIKFKTKVADPSKRQEYIDWMKKKCGRRLVTIIRASPAPIAMLVVDDSDSARVAIEYVVVDERCRERGLGKRLVAEIQSRSEYLVAEALSLEGRNLLIRCAFKEFETHSQRNLEWQKRQL